MDRRDWRTLLLDERFGAGALELVVAVAELKLFHTFVYWWNTNQRKEPVQGVVVGHRTTPLVLVLVLVLVGRILELFDVVVVEVGDLRYLEVRRSNRMIL